MLVQPGWQADMVSRELLDEGALAASSVVANCAMNRERQLAGVNSYTQELGFNPLEWLRSRTNNDSTRAPARVAWLDLCCGTGRALIQAAEQAQHDGIAERIRLVGVDLVDVFDPHPSSDTLELVTGTVTAWTPPHPFDLITCVHGLHYVGDKLTVITRAAAALTDTGLFIADFDATSIRLPDGRPAGRVLTNALRAAGVSWDARRRRITCHGRRELRLPFVYLGADDRAGPNYTNQPAVHSYYRQAGNGS